MDLTSGRAMYNPDETVKPLRLPKSRPDGHQMQQPQQSMAGVYQQSSHILKANAPEFVPRGGSTVDRDPAVLQERSQMQQKQYLQQNYPQYNQHQQSYSNGYDQQQQIMTQMNSMQLSGGGGVQSRLNLANRSINAVSNGANNGVVAGAGGNTANDGHICFYPQNQTYNQRSYNKQHHVNNHHQQQRNNNHQNNYQNQQRQNNYHHQQQQQQHQNHHQQQQQQQQHQYHNQQHQQHQHQHHNQHQNYQDNTESSAAAAATSSTTDSSAAVDDMPNIALDYLQTVMQCLNQNPGQLDAIVPRFVTIFEGMENNEYVLSIAMEDIFKESIRNPNFRYMGAKLYCLLHLLNPSKDSLFNTFLKCKLDFHQRDIQRYMEKHQQNKVRETALFLAELYMQLRDGESRILLIAENIVYSLKQLLQHVINDNVRCICLTLKLAGYDLATDCPKDMQDIIAKLEQINNENPGKYPLANNVITLQKNNWGRKTSGSEAASDNETSTSTEPLRASDDPVFYGPDGREITAEECEFLTNGAGSGSNNSGNSTDNEDNADLYLSELCGATSNGEAFDINGEIVLDDLDPEMDEETKRDYRLFLKKTNNL